MQRQQSAKAEAVTKALTYRYIKTEGDEATVDSEGAIDMLRAIAGEALVGNAPLLAIIAEEQPDCVLAPAERAIISSIDDCTKLIFALADLEMEVEQQLRLVIPEVASAIIAAPDLPLTEERSVLTVMDQLVEAMIGWSSSLGKSGEKLYEKTREVIETLRAPDANAATIDADLRAFIQREQGRIAKLEERLSASEMGLMRSRQSRNMTANMINRATENKRLSASIVAFLQGPWFDSIQLLLLNKGFESDEWHRAGKLTETIVWTYQPIEGNDAVAEADKQRLYRIIEHLPGEIRELLVALEHDTRGAEVAIEDIESDHVSLVSGQALEYVDFEPIDCEPDTLSRSKVSRLLLRKVNALSEGQWFTYEQDDASTRIKLVLKADDVKQLLFTNRNGVKALQKGFDEFAYYLSSGVVKPLNHEAVFSSTFRTYYDGLIEEHARQTRRTAERRVAFDEEEQAREAARQKAQVEAAALARANEEAERQRRADEKRNRLERAKAEAQKAENADAVAMLTDKVKDLAIGAWLKLPGPDGELEDCKLAVRISASDKLIFVTRAGTKIGEYSSEQLVQLLVAGEGQIQDAGVEFEDTLAAVVTRLRQDRSKSYDDLTGS